MRLPSRVFFAKAGRVLWRKADSLIGRCFPLAGTLGAGRLRVPVSPRKRRHRSLR